MIHSLSIVALMKAVKIARENPHAVFKVPGSFGMTAADVLSLWSRGVMGRCSRGLPDLGRHDTEDWRHDQRVIHDWTQRRTVHPGRNVLKVPELRRRYPEINNPSMFD